MVSALLIFFYIFYSFVFHGKNELFVGVSAVNELKSRSSTQRHWPESQFVHGLDTLALCGSLKLYLESHGIQEKWKRCWKVMEFEELKRVQTLCNYTLDSLKDSEEKLLMGC